MKRLLLPLLFAAALRAQEPALVSLAITPGPEVEGAASAAVIVSSRTDATLTDVDVDVELTTFADATLAAIAFPPVQTCTSIDAKHLRCRVSVLYPNSRSTLWITILPREGRYTLNARALGVAAVPHSFLLRREITVTNTRDAGEGSLRAAIETANAVGVPVEIRFAFDEAPVGKAFVIRPLTPLPAITASDIRIVAPGAMHSDRVELDGALVSGGSGLELRGEGPFEIEGLIVGGFPWDGISVRRASRPELAKSRIASVDSGLHRDGTPNPNRSRGITLDAPTADVLIFASHFSANARSGLFLAGATHIDLYSSFMDDNGASGVFAGPGSRDVLIRLNRFARNAHFGVAIARGATRVRITTFFAEGNGNLVIDHGLDGFSGYAFNGFHPPAPFIESAVYDPLTSTTTIRGTFDAPDPSIAWKITLHAPYRITEYGDRPETIVSGNRFTMTLPGPGAGPMQVLADTVEITDWSTSEFSNAVASVAGTDAGPPEAPSSFSQRQRPD